MFFYELFIFILQNTAIDYSQEIVARWKQQGAGQKPVDLTMGVMVRSLRLN